MKNRAAVLAAALSLLAGLPAAAWAAGDYPVKPIELYCPYVPGSSMDVMARLIGEIAPKYIGQPIVVVNKPGAAGSLAAAEVISAKPDGYKMTTQANMFFATTTKIQKIPFNPDDLVKRIKTILEDHGGHRFNLSRYTANDSQA